MCLLSYRNIILFGIVITSTIGIGRLPAAYGETIARARASEPFVLQRYDVKGSFDEANSSCQSEHGWLAEVKTDKIYEDLKILIGDETVWIGGHYTNTDGWRWLDGSPILWGKNNHHQLDPEQCLTFNAAGNFSTKACNRNTYMYVCQVATPSTFFYNGSEFRIPSEIFDSNTTANDACLAWDEKAHLVDIVDEGTDQRIKEELDRREETAMFYTGGNDNANEGRWVWSNGGSIGDYDNWETHHCWFCVNEPNGGTNENCLLLSRDGVWKWYDYACNTAGGKAICQRRIDNDNCSSDFCSDRGRCVVESEISGMTFRCHCDNLHVGRMCEIDPCLPNPCQNSGTCNRQSQSPYYTCNCVTEYHGQDCEERTFKEFGNCAYHVNLIEKTTQRQVSSVCSSITSSSLAILKDRNSREFISRIFQTDFQNSNEKVWIGGTRTKKRWSWFDGSSATPMYPPGEDSSNTDYKCITALVATSLDVTASQCNHHLGYICEKPTQGSPCSSQPCLNHGTCENVGCHYKCVCVPGYAGTNCNDDLIELTILQDEITMMKHEMANVTVTVNSRVGNVTVEVRRGLHFSLHRESQVSSGTHKYALGPFNTPYFGYKVTVVVLPNDRTFSRHSTITINVADLPSVAITRERISLPIIPNHITISCTIVRGTPSPTIKWYKGEEKVRKWRGNPDEIYQAWDYIALPQNTRKDDAGVYTCRATNTINGEDYVDEKDLYLTIPPQLVEESMNTTNDGIISISCKFESFPSSNISWTYIHDQISKDINIEPGSIFNFTQQSYSNFQEGVLQIALPEWLSHGEIKCIATNRFDTAESSQKINRRIRTYNGTLYTFTDPNNKMTREESEQYCTTINSEICTINDDDTDNNLLRDSLILLGTASVHVGGRAYDVNGSRIWRWNDGRMIYNESKYHKWVSKYTRIIDGIYVGWASEKPSNHGGKRCMVFRNSHEQYRWSNVQCTSSLPTICQMPIHGSPTIHYAGAGNCSTTIRLSWSPSPAALSIKHRIDVIPTATDRGIKQDTIEVNATENNYQLDLRNLSSSTTYKIRIYPCPGVCAEEGGVTRYVTTGAGIPEPDFQVNVSHAVETSSCIVSWTNHHISKGIIGHRIIAVSSLVRASSDVKVAYKDLEEINRPVTDTRYIHNVLPNRNYSYSVQARTCAGLSLPKVADGQCVTDSAAPNYVPAPTPLSDEISESGIMEMMLPLVDETNGPVSCIFILVDTTNSRSFQSKDIDGGELRTASYSLRTRQTPFDTYISLAVSAKDMARIGGRGNTTLVIGDNTTSSCNANLDPTSGSSRTKRESDPGDVYYGYNAPLNRGLPYRIFTVSATPTNDGRVVYGVSAPQQVGTSKQPNGSSMAWVAGVAVGLLAIVLLIGFFIIRRKATPIKVKPESEPIELQEQQNGWNAGSTDPVYENYTAVTDDVRTKTDIPFAKLEATYNAMLENKGEGFQTQYKELKDNSEKLRFPQEYGSDSQALKKNRYKNILPYDKNIVKLTGGSPANYINASFIEGFRQGNKFIATQGPLPATVNGFWRMVAERECHTIVMLTKCVESAKKKCEKYWPDLGQSERYGQVNVENQSEELKSGYIVRSFNVSTGRQASSVQQFQYLNWPDHGVPVTTSDFFRLHRAVSRRLESAGSNVPTIVHCSAGAGRTGAFISYDYLSEEGKILHNVDVYSCVFNLRRQRIQMVQNKDQYTFVYKLLLEDYLFGDTEIATADVTNKFRDQDSHITLGKEFANLDKVKPMQCGNPKPMPPSWNRNKNMAPYAHSLVVIQRLPGEEIVPYLNASFIPVYNDSMVMIAAEGPKENLIDIFWRGIFDNNVSLIVMLTDCVESNEPQCAQYWPDEVGNVMTLQCMTVEIAKVYRLNEKTIAREFMLVRENMTKNVVQHQFKDWPTNTCPPDTSLVLALISKLKFAVRQTKKPTILVHCSDGAGRTGAFCTIMNVIDRLNAENVVDVFRTVKDLRDFRPGMVSNEELYKFCYKAISDYLVTSSVYSNFEIENKESLYANL